MTRGAKMGHVVTAETRAKIGAANKGHTLTPDQQERQRLAVRLPVSPALRRLRVDEAAWLGAMLDAEGHLLPAGCGITNTELEIISACLRITQTGSVYMTKGVNKPCWVWQVTSYNTARALFIQIAPWSMKAQGWLGVRVV